jgi:hypothetical protein
VHLHHALGRYLEQGEYADVEGVTLVREASHSEPSPPGSRAPRGPGEVSVSLLHHLEADLIGDGSDLVVMPWMPSMCSGSSARYMENCGQAPDGEEQGHRTVGGLCTGVEQKHWGRRPAGTWWLGPWERRVMTDQPAARPCMMHPLGWRAVVHGTTITAGRA